MADRAPKQLGLWSLAAAFCVATSLSWSAEELPAAPELPPALQADLHLLRAQWRLDEGDTALALINLDRAEALAANHGIQLPPTYWLRRAQALERTGQDAGALAALDRLLAAGTDTESYWKGIKLRKAVRLRLLAAEADLWLAKEAPRQRAKALRLAAAGPLRDPLRSGGQGPAMAVIPAGWFQMGSKDSWAVHRVDIAEPFAMGVYEVTWDDWRTCVEAGGCERHQHLSRSAKEHGTADRPVERVSWDDVQLYVAWLSSATGRTYRLPSEAEWEYAARAGSATRYAWGNDMGEGRANCNKGCGRPFDFSTGPVGSFAANAFGLYDMHGNVSEWVADWWHTGYTGASSDGSARRDGESSRRVMRGGGYHNSHWHVRSAYRVGGSVNWRADGDGFRVARDVEPGELP